MKRTFAAFVALLAVTWAAIAASPLLLYPSTTHDGISLDFTKGVGDGCCYVKAPGQAARRDSFQNLFTFTRNGPATFVGSNGLIQYANENRVLQSQALATTWTVVNASIVSNSVVAPDGTLTADTLHEDATAGASHQALQTVLASPLVTTGSAYFKAANRTWAYIQVGSGTNTAFVNLTTCTVGVTQATVISATAWSAGDGWCRLVVTAPPGSNNFFLGSASADGTGSYNGLDQDSIYVWGVQAQFGRNVGVYLPTTTAAKYDQPRIDYSTSGELLGLLTEGGVTNRLLQSEDFTTTWANTNTTDAANTAVAPDGNTTADTITASAANGTITQNFQASTDNSTRVFSVYLKRLTGSGNVTVEVGRTSSAACTLSLSAWNRCYVADTSLSGTYAVVTNVVTVAAVGHGLNTGDAARLDYTTGAAADLSCASVTVLTADTFTCPQATADTSGNVTVYAAVARIKIATNGDAVYAWGAQGEAQASQNVNPATSYIPTASATVTRPTDQAIRTLGAEYNQLAGTAVVRLTPTTTGSSNVVRIDDGGGTNSISFAVTSALDNQVVVTASSVTQAGFTSGVSAPPRRTAIAAAWATNNFAASGDGTAPSEDPVGTVPVVTRIGFMGNQVQNFGSNARIFTYDYWPERKPNSFLVAKTQPGIP